MLVGIDLTFLTKDFCGGKDQVIHNLLKGFAEIGVSGSIVCFCRGGIEEYIKIIDQSFNVITVPESKEGEKRIIYNRRVGKIVSKEIDKQGINLLFFANKQTPIMKYHVPTVFVSHDIQSFIARDNPKLTRYGWKSDMNVWFDFRLRDYVVAISDYDKSEIHKYFPKSKSDVRRIYDPIQFDERVLRKDKKYITMLNIFWKHKNVETVIKAYVQIAKNIEYDLMLIGRVPNYIDDLKLVIKEAGIENRIHFPGYVSDDEMKEYLDSTRLFINASYFEGFGMPAVEMMGKGIPTIVADNSAQREVTRNYAGYYSPTDDYNELAKAIMDELNNPKPEEKLSEIGSIMRSEYDYRKIATEYWEYFEEINGRKN